jgi:hypothetical protein
MYDSSKNRIPVLFYRYIFSHINVLYVRTKKPLFFYIYSPTCARHIHILISDPTVVNV